jgi:predicted lipoprotein
MTAPSPMTRNAGAAAAVVILIIAIFFGTKFLSPEEAAALNPAAFNAETYADTAFPKVTAELTKKATDIAVLAKAIDADPAAAGKQFGTDIGSGKYSYPVKASGTVKSVDENFMELEVAGLTKDKVRIPLGAAISGTPVRDATGTITFSDFVGQTDFQSVANQFKIKIQKDVIGKIDPKSLEGKPISVVGAWTSGGPPNSFIIQPVSIEAGA